MLQYLINTTVVWLMSLVLFDVFLKKENYHAYNRFYLLFTFLLGVCISLWQWLAGITMYETVQELMPLYATWIRWVTIIYTTGAAAACILLVVDILKLVVQYNKGIKSTDDTWTIVETGKEHAPFSYLDILFVNSKDNYREAEWHMITTHEKQHSILLHVIDMLVIHLARIIFWFHPLVYIYNNRLLLVHEYQADRAASEQPQEYGRFLVEQAVLKGASSIAHSFNRSPIKNRIVMLTKNKLPRTGKSNLKLLLVLPLTTFCLLFFTQNSYSGNKITPGNPICKKQISRTIEIKSAEEDLGIRRIRDVSPDTTLMEMMVNAIKAGKLTAYRNYDNFFTTKMTKNDLDDVMGSKTDTVAVQDPVTGKEIIKYIRMDFDYRLIHKYRILEEWTYNWETGKTEIKTLGICPLREIYNDNGTLRGAQAMFCLKFADAKALINRYELYHPDNTIGSLIWNDYFDADQAGTNKK